MTTRPIKAWDGTAWIDLGVLAPNMSGYATSSHKGTHATGGSDQLTPADIGAAPAASPTLTGIITATNTTDSSSSTTGAALFAGGVGVAKKLYVGTSFDVGTKATIGTAATNANDNVLTVGTTGNGFSQNSASTLIVNAGKIGGYTGLNGLSVVGGNNGTSTQLFNNADNYLVNITGSYLSTSTYTAAGSMLNVARAANPYNANTITITGAVAKISDSAAPTGGATVTNSATTLDVTQNQTTATGPTLFITNKGSGNILTGANNTATVFSVSNAGTVTATTFSGSGASLTSIPQSAVTNLSTDLAAKAPTASPTFTGTVTLPSNTSIGTVSDTEIGYLDGVTSSIQTQLNGKATISHTHAISDITSLQTTLDGKQPIDGDLTAIAGLSGSSGILKKTAADTWELDTTAYTTNTGTVTSVGVSVPTGLTVSNTPVTTSGTIAIGLDTGYEIPTTSALAAKAPLASPTFTGTVTAPTITGTDTTDASSSTTGALKTAGGLGVAKKLYVGTDAAVGGNLTVTGNLTINGTTTTFNSTTLTVDDPIITLGGDTAPTSDDNKDRGVEFRYHDGTSARLGFFGYDDSAQNFVFLTSATNTSEVFTGTKATIDANLSGSNINAGTVSASYIDAAIARNTGTSDLEITTSNGGVVLKSSNGTRYKITVANDGSLTTTAI